MPPDSRADGPCGPKARRTRGPASPGQRTAQPFGGTLNASPLRCASGASALEGVPQASRRPSPCAGHRPLAGVPRALRRPPYTRGIGPRRRSPRLPPPAATHGASAPAGVPQAATHADRRPRGASAPAGVPQVSRRPPPHTGPQPSRAFRRPPAVRRPRGASALAAHAALAGVSQAARARSQPAPAARFSRKPPCGIGSRMVYCT